MSTSFPKTDSAKIITSGPQNNVPKEIHVLVACFCKPYLFLEKPCLDVQDKLSMHLTSTVTDLTEEDLTNGISSALKRGEPGVSSPARKETLS